MKCWAALGSWCFLTIVCGVFFSVGLMSLEPTILVEKKDQNSV